MQSEISDVACSAMEKALNQEVLVGLALVVKEKVTVQLPDFDSNS